MRVASAVRREDEDEDVFPSFLSLYIRPLAVVTRGESGNAQETMIRLLCAATKIQHTAPTTTTGIFEDREDDAKKE